MVAGTGHDFSVDWWALGVLIYEMLIGVTPFYNKNPQMLKSKIKNAKVVFPDRLQYRIDYSDELVDIVNKLLKKERTKRLGSKDGQKEILSHPWFKGVDVVKLESYQVVPPFVPKHDNGNLTQFYNSKSSEQDLQDTVLTSSNMK